MNHIVLDLSPSVLAATRAKLLEHRMDRARYLQPSANARIAAELAGTSSDASLATGGGNMVDAGHHRSGKPCTTLDRVQLAALRAFRSGMMACEYPKPVFRRLFDLEQLGLVEKLEGVYWITTTGIAALRGQ